MADDNDQVLASFIVQRRLTKVLPSNKPIGDPLWSIVTDYEGEGRSTTLGRHNIETKEAQDRILTLVKEMGA